MHHGWTSLCNSFRHIHDKNMEIDVISQTQKPVLYKRYVDDIFTRRRTQQSTDQLFENLHKNIKITCVVSPEKFLDTRLICQDTTYLTEVHHKETKITPHWSSCTPKRYKRNAINSVTSTEHKEFLQTSPKKRKSFAINSLKLIIQTILSVTSLREYDSKHSNENPGEDDELIIPTFLFQEPKQFIMFEIPYCSENELVAKRFLHKFHEFTNGQYEVAIRWMTRKVKSLFSLKDKNPYPSYCVIYRGLCDCGENYIGETMRNSLTRWNEREDIRKESKPAKHLREVII